MGTSGQSGERLGAVNSSKWQAHHRAAAWVRNGGLYSQPRAAHRPHLDHSLSRNLCLGPARLCRHPAVHQLGHLALFWVQAVGGRRLRGGNTRALAANGPGTAWQTTGFISTPACASIPHAAARAQLEAASHLPSQPH